MAFLWLAVVFNYYLLLYMINSFRLVYLSAIGNSLSDLTGNYLGYKLQTFLSIKATLLVSLGISLLGGLAIYLYGLDNQESMMFPMFVFVAKLGIDAAFYTIYIAHAKIFETSVSTTVFGICNFGARLASVFAPMLAM